MTLAKPPAPYTDAWFEHGRQARNRAFHANLRREREDAAAKAEVDPLIDARLDRLSGDPDIVNAAVRLKKSGDAVAAAKRILGGCVERENGVGSERDLAALRCTTDFAELQVSRVTTEFTAAQNSHREACLRRLRAEPTLPDGPDDMPLQTPLDAHGLAVERYWKSVMESPATLEKLISISLA